ncbi:hypothetical protein [Rhizobium sp. NPDC090279]|uniref:hypothetical protein n=1 Tax=Rhizobium sp. NPDC090279 TaxID=3364499 RepID=UPI003839D030
MSEPFFEILLDDYSKEYLNNIGVDINEALLAENPELKLAPRVGKPSTKDVATVIAATAALSPMVVPIVKELIQRLIPHVEVTTKTTTTNGVTTTEIHTKQS